MATMATMTKTQLQENTTKTEKALFHLCNVFGLGYILACLMRYARASFENINESEKGKQLSRDILRIIDIYFPT